MIKTFLVNILNDSDKNYGDYWKNLDNEVNDFLNKTEEDNKSGETKVKIAKQTGTETLIIPGGLIIRTITFNLIDNPTLIRTLNKH